MYNLLSLGLGILAWIFGGIAAICGKFRGSSFLSFGLCGFSLVLQFYEVSRQVGLNDWSALMDTDGVTIFAANTLLTVTLALNAIALLRDWIMQKRR